MNLNYQKWTDRAVEFEQSGSYRRAAEAWLKAAQHARKPENITWCEQRADYCKRMKR